MKRGPKPKDKIRLSTTIDRTLKTEIDSRTENLSGYLNEAGWDKVRKDAKRPPLGRDKSSTGNTQVTPKGERN